MHPNQVHRARTELPTPKSHDDSPCGSDDDSTKNARPSYRKWKTEPISPTFRQARVRFPLGRIDSYLDLDLLLNEDDGSGQGIFSIGEDEQVEDTKESANPIVWLALATISAMCITIVPFEILNKTDRGCGDLILFAQVAYAATECLLSGGMQEFLFNRKIPMMYHICTLLFERGRNALYNAALDMGLPMPVYLVIKNSGLVVSMALGWSVQRKKYKYQQVLGVFVITLGVIISTFASRPAPKNDVVSDKTPIDHHTFLLAAASMAAGVVVTAAMNVVQERAFSKHGNHFQESMFYSSVLLLPIFVFDASSIRAHASTWSSRWMEFLNVSLPYMWILLLINIVAQSAMKVSCLKLTALGGQVSNVIVVTVARFVGLAMSALALNSPPFPRISFWVGGILVLGGTLGYVLAGRRNETKKQD